VSGAKSLGRVALKTGANIVSDIANKQEGNKVRDIVANRVTESVKGLADKLQQTGKGRKREHKPAKRKHKPAKKKAKFNDVFA
jgi:hypothetical protein